MGNKQVWAIIGALVVLFGAAFAYVLLTKPKVEQMPSTGTQTPNTATPGPTPSAPVPGSFVDYSSAALANAQGRTLLFFYASWCPQCRDLEKSIQQTGVPDGMTILKVNYDTELALKQRYGVTLQTTVVEVDKVGNQIAKFVAYNEPTLPAVLKALTP